MCAEIGNYEMHWFPVPEQCEFTWIIENLPSFPRSEKNYFLRSPVFSTSLKSLCRWYMKLCPNAPDEPENEMDLYLYRLREDTGPKMVSVSCNISIRGDEKCIFPEKRFDQDFKRGSNFKISLNPFEEILEEILSDKKDSSKILFTIICDMFIYAEPTTPRLETDRIVPPMMPGLMQLSQDMEALFWSGNFADAYVQATDGSIKAHKVVLAARSTVYKEILLKDTSDYPTIEFENFPQDIASKLLVYLYSGKLNISEQDMPFMFAIREWANKNKLLHLMEALVPNKIKARSVVETELCKFCWEVEDLTIPGEGYIQSQFFGFCNQSRGNWFLRLRPRFYDDVRGQIDVEMGVQNLSRSVYFHVDIFINNKVGSFETNLDASTSLDADQVVPLRNPSTTAERSEGETLNYLTKDDAVSVRCTLEICEANPITGNIEKYQTCAETCNPLRTSLWELSINLMKMHKTAHFCDKMLKVWTRHMRVHRSILCARSPVFAGMFQELEDSGGPCGELTVPDLTSDVLLNLIEYIYSGQFSASGFAEAESLYLAAERYLVPILRV